MTVAEFESIALTIGVGGLILYMFYIIYKLAHESKAGRYGAVVLFIALGLGMVGFVAKTVLVEVFGM